MFARAKAFFRDELGNSVVEYALILSLVALVAVFGLRVLGTNANTKLTDVSSAVSISAAADPTGTNGSGNGGGTTGNGANNGGNGNNGNGNNNGGNGNNGNGNNNGGNGNGYGHGKNGG